MAKLTREQLEKWNAGAGNGFFFDVQQFLLWSEKRLVFKGEEKEDGLHYVIKLSYYSEKAGEVPTITVDRYKPTGSGLCTVVEVYRETAGGPKAKKMFSNLQKISKTLDTAEILRKAEQADTGKDYYSISDFSETEEEIAESKIESEGQEQAGENEVETPETASEVKEILPTDQVTEGMAFTDSEGKKWTITALSSMSVEFNGGTKCIYDFGTSRTVKAILDAIGNGARVLTDSKEPQKEETTPETQLEQEQKIYKYGMRLRGFSIGCQPAGVVERSDDTTGKYWDIITYNRPLTGEEMRTYSLDDLNDNKINRILTEYAAQYERLYNSNNSKLEQSASAQFDAYAKENEDFISEICNAKGDFISSDREAAALMIALVKLGYAKIKRLDTSREEKTTETAPEDAETALTGEAEEVHAEGKKCYMETYVQPSTGQKIAVEEIKGKYYNIYGYDTKEAVMAGGFETIEKAREMIQKHRPGSIIDGEPAPKGNTATPSPVSKSDTKETPEENSGTHSGDSKNYTMGSDNTEGKSDTPSGDEKSYATKTAVKYYEISEETARLAHEMMSFRDYKKNSATDEYRASVDRAAEVAEEQKRKVSPYYHVKIDALLDRYARRLAEWTNAYNRNRASCPSVMICGSANFPTRKKEKQNSRENTLWKEYEDIKGIIDKIKSVGTGAIDLADPHARELLQERLDSLKGQLELDKKLNAYWKKHKTFIGCPDISADFAEKLTKETNDMFERCAWMSKPFPDYNLASIRDKIKRTQARLDQLNTMQEKANDEDRNTEIFDGGEIFRNYEQNRLQIIFNEKPDEETRSKLKSNGFRWSPRNSAWQRQLTANAERAARQVLKLA